MKRIIDEYLMLGVQSFSVDIKVGFAIFIKNLPSSYFDLNEEDQFIRHGEVNLTLKEKDNPESIMNIDLLDLYLIKSLQSTRPAVRVKNMFLAFPYLTGSFKLQVSNGFFASSKVQFQIYST